MTINTQKNILDGEMLVREYALTRNPELRENVIKAYLPLVKHIIGRMNFIDNNVLKKEDAYQFGIIGMIDALERYDPEVGVAFKSFAYRRIHGEIIDALRKVSVLNKEQIHDNKSIIQSIEKLRDAYGYEPTDEEISHHTGLSMERLRKIQLINQFRRFVSLEDRITLNNGETVNRKDTIADENQPVPDYNLNQSDLKQELRQIVQDLPERKRVILALYYYEELTLADIGQVLNISESRVSQILSETLKNIRQKVAR